ncbi:MAG TPA: hypothetical protein VN203_13490 [Candidatus Acidoferrum sp.]|nr:hypothetical protein [Candidatus Acidoferrum sp.]
MAAHLFNRRKFLIRPRFQLLLASKAVAFLLLSSTGIIYASLYSVAETIYVLPFNCLTPEVKARLWRFPTEAVLLSALIALIVILQAIVITHRVAGPEFRLTQTVRGMATGQYPHTVILRKHDNLKELAVSVGFLGQALNQRRQICLEQLDQVDAALTACATEIGRHERSKQVQAQFEGLRKQICTLRELVGEGTDPGTCDEQSPPAATERSLVSCGAPERGSGHALA